MMNSGAKLQLKVKMKMLLYIKERLDGNDGLTIPPSKRNKQLADKKLMLSFSPPPKTSLRM
jgi:hypothetical protein